MLLLLLAGAGVNVAGVRAYATVSYSTVDDGGSSLALVNPTVDSTSAVVDARPTEE